MARAISPEGSQRLERLFWTDAFYRDELLEEAFVFESEERDELWIDVSAGGVSFEIQNGVEGHLRTDAGLEELDVRSGTIAS